MAEEEKDVATLPPSISVEVAQLGRQTIKVTLSPNSTVDQALEAAGIGDVDEFNLFVQALPAEPLDKVRDQDIITLVPNMVGGA